MAFDAAHAGRLRAAGLRVAERILRDNPGCEAYLTGSFYAGLGTGASDVDLFVVVEPDREDEIVVADRAPGTAADVTHVLVDGIVVDVDRRTTKDLRRLASRFARYEFTFDRADQVSLHPWPLMHACRLYLGEPVGPSPVVRTCRDQLDGHVLRKLLIAHYAFRCSHLQRDFRGQSTLEDVATVLHLAHHMLMYALEAMAAGCGHIWYGEKWTWVKLRSLDPAVFTMLRDAAFRPGPDLADDPGRLGRAWMLTAQACLCAALTDGWETAGAGRWTAWPAAGAAGSGPTRSPDWVPIRTADEVLLGSLDDTIAFSEEGLRLWGLCDGRPRGQVVEGMRRWLEASSSGASSPDGVEEYLDELIAVGVVRVP